MTDPFRSGGFGGLSLTGPFQIGSGGFGQYNIGDLESQTAALDKYVAETAWNNGLITDDAYIKALNAYVASTAKGSRERVSATNELADAVYTIGRNSRVRAINNATGTAKRIAGWGNLIAWDRKHLSTMTRDNEQWRELTDRIAEEEGNIRKEGWAALVKRYNGGHVTTAAMLAAAKRLANRSGDGPDHAEWVKQVLDFTERGLDETQTELEYAYNNAKPAERNAAGRAALAFLDQRLGGMDRAGPAYAAMARHRDEWARGIHANEMAAKDSAMDESHDQGKVADDVYVAYYQKRVADAPRGSDELRQMRTKLLSVAFTASENRARGVYQQTGDPSKLIDVYLGAQAGMTRGSQAWTQLNTEIANLQAAAYQAFSIFDAPESLGAGYSPGGHLIAPANFGTPTNAQGFASQFDGSPFGSENCVYASAAMLAWASGVEGLSGGRLRWYAGDTEGGGYLSDVGRAFDQVGLGTNQQADMSLGSFRRKVVNGKGAVVIGIYGNLSGPYRLSDFAGAHGVYVDSAKKGKDGRWYYYVMDPLGRSADQGAQWWSEDALKAYGWSGMTNPTSGNRSFGNVIFATGGKARVVNRGAPPFQAFDTDANGRSTVGQGGGTNRREAGSRPPGWRKANAATRARDSKLEGIKISGKGQAGGAKAEKAEAIQDFMGAITRMGGQFQRNVERTPEEEVAFRSRASKAWEQGGGDARLAAIAFFSGAPADPDSSHWTDLQRWQANGVGAQYHLEIVPKGGLGVIDPRGQAQEPGKGTAPSKAPAAASAGETIAIRFLGGIGAPDTPENRRAVMAMLDAQFGGRPQPLNIFGLKTDGPNDLPGQTGLNDGWAVFADPGASIDAAAADMVGNPRYALLLGAFRNDDQKGIADQIGTSGWDDPAFGGNRFAHSYNKLPGAGDPLFPQVSHLNVPSSLGDLSSKVPEIEMLVNGDPTDERWKTWYDSNRDAILDADDAGHSSWTYTRPDGTTVDLPMDHGLAVDIADNNFQHASDLAAIARNAGDYEGARTLTIAASNVMTDVTMDGADQVIAQMDQLAQDAMANGQAYEAVQIYNGELDFLSIQVLGAYRTEAPSIGLVTRTRIPDIAARTNPWIGADEADKVGALIDRLSDPTQVSGALLGLMEPDAQGRNGFTRDGNVNPDRGYWSQLRNERSNRYEMVLVTDRDKPEQFRPTLVVDAATGEDTGETVPFYRNPANGLMPVSLTTGLVVYQPVNQSDNLPVAVYATQPVSSAKTVTVYGGRGGPQPGLTPPSAGPGPVELRPVTQIAGLRSFTTADPSDASPNQRAITWYSVDGVVWVGAPQGEVPALVSNVKGAFTRDAATRNLLLNGNPLKPEDYAKTFVFYGFQEGGDPYGKAGIGSPGRQLPYRVGDATGGFDTKLTPRERVMLGGDQWTKRDQNAWRALFAPTGVVPRMDFVPPVKLVNGVPTEPYVAPDRQVKTGPGGGAGAPGGKVLTQAQVDDLRDTVPWGAVADSLAALPRYGDALVGVSAGRAIAGVAVALAKAQAERLRLNAEAAAAAAPKPLRVQIKEAGGVLPRVGQPERRKPWAPDTILPKVAPKVTPKTTPPKVEVSTGANQRPIAS